MDATTQQKQAPMPLSHTRLKQYEQCPMAYKLHYLDRAASRSRFRTLSLASSYTARWSC